MQIPVGSKASCDIGCTMGRLQRQEPLSVLIAVHHSTSSVGNVEAVLDVPSQYHMNDENTTISRPPNPSNLKGLLVLPKEFEEELAFTED